MKKLTTLDNGLRIVTHHMASVKSVSFGVFNNAGSRDETEDINGTAHFLEHMAFKGTKTRSAEEITQTVADVGGFINAFTSKETTTYVTRLLAENLNIGVDIISDILQNSTFESKGFEKERGVILEEIAMYEDDPFSKVNEQWNITAFPDQPIGRYIGGTKEIIQSIKRETIADFMQNYYHPKKMVFTAAGLVDHDEFVDMIVKSTPNLPQGKADSRIKGFYKGGEYREEKKLEQINMRLGFDGLDYHDDDYESLWIYSVLIGGGQTSRLFQEIREKRGLAYQIGSDYSPFSDCGSFDVFAGTGKDKITELLPVLCDELINSAKNITEEEITRAKTQIKSSMIMSLESSSSNATTAAYQLLRYNRLIDMEEDIEKINNVSKESIEKVVQKMLQSKPTIASIGPIKNLEKLENIQSRFI
jgi:predicted Zn-dependent peptidase